MSRKEPDVRHAHHAPSNDVLGTAAGEAQPEHDTTETQLEARNYFERKHINQILESIVTGLTFTKPDDPLSYIEDCVHSIRKGNLLSPGKSSKLHWDLFIAPPQKEAPPGPLRSSSRQQGKVPPLRNKKLAPIPQPSSKQLPGNVIIMPEVSSKPIVSKKGGVGAGGKGEGGAGGKAGGVAKQQSVGDGLATESDGLSLRQAEGKPHPQALHLMATPSALDLATAQENQTSEVTRPVTGRMTAYKTIPPISHADEGVMGREGSAALRSGEALRGGKKTGTGTGGEEGHGAGKVEEVSTSEKLGQQEEALAAPVFKGPAWDNVVFVLGGPGCGKGTNCVRIAKDFNYSHLSAGDLLRDEVATGSDLGKELDAMMKEGKIVPMQVTLRLLHRAMLATDDADGFLIDGFPRQLDQAEAFERLITPCKFVLYFECTEELLEKRLLERGKTSGRADDNMATIKKRFRTFVETSLPVVKRFEEAGKCITISSEPPMEEVYANVKKHFEKVEPLYHNNVVFVLGGPGSGKGTQCLKLKDEFHLTHLSSGDLLRAEIEKGSDIGRDAEELMKEGKMVPTTVILGLIRKAMEENMDTPGFLIDGFPRAMDQAHLFEQMIGPPRAVLYFHCPLEVLEQRLLDRGKTSGRVDDNLETIKKRFRTFEELSMGVVEHYKGRGKCVQVSSEESVEKVYEIARQLFIPPSPVNHPNVVFVLGGPGCGKGTQCKRLATDFQLNHVSTGDLLRAEVEQGTHYGKMVERAMAEGGLAGNKPPSLPPPPLNSESPTPPPSLHKKHKKEKEKPKSLAEFIPLPAISNPPKRRKIRDDLVDFRTKLLCFSSGWQDIVMDLLNTDIVKRYQDYGFLIDGFPRAIDQALEFERVIGKPRTVLYFQAPFSTLEQRLLSRAKSSGRADDKHDIIMQRFKTFKDESLAVVRYYRRSGVLKKIPATGSIQEVYDSAKEVMGSLPPVVEGSKPRTAKPKTAKGREGLPFDGESLVFVLGGPGSGKGTQCARIVETLGWAHLSTGDLLRDEVKKGSELGKQLEADMREGKMVPLSITMDLLKSAMESQRGKPGFLIDGFPRTMEQAELFEKSIGHCTFVLFFSCPNEILTQRLLKRGETSGRADDNLESIGKRLKTFEEMSLPVVQHFGKDGRVREVKAEGDVEDITRNTLKQFE